MAEYYRGVLLVFLSATSFSFLPIFTVYAYQGGINVNTLLVIRFSVASLILFGYLLFKVKAIKIKKEQFLPLFIMGIFYTVQATAFVTAVKYIPASLVSLLLYMYPMIVAILAAVFDQEKLSIGTVAAIIAAFAGLTLVLGTGYDSINYVGVLYALSAALIYSIYITLGNRIIKALAPMETSAFISLFAALCLLAFGLGTRSINFNFLPITWAWAVAIAIVATVIAMLTFFWGMDLIGSTNASILSMLEPVITIGFSMVLFGEKFTLSQAIGAVLVLLCAVMVVYRQKKEQEVNPNFTAT